MASKTRRGRGASERGSSNRGPGARSRAEIAQGGELVLASKPLDEDDAKARSDSLRAALQRADALAKRIADAMTSDLSGAEAVAKQRR